jgi:wobble nucleotide-excising tRNase
MIALTYYLAASIEKYKSFDEFKEVIFLIDDPISSISY